MKSLASVLKWIAPRASLRNSTASLLAVALACASSSGPPQVTPQGTLGIQEEGEDPLSGPFRVVFAGPQTEGQLEDTPTQSQVSVVFNQPVVSLSSQTEAIAAPPFTIQPTVAGTWRSIGTRAFLFAPEAGRLPEATEFEVRIPASFRALDGSTLQEDYAWKFTTERPRLLSSYPWSGQTGISRNQQLELVFNQDMSAALLQNHLRLSVKKDGKKTDVSFSLAQVSAQNARRWKLQPKTPLPAAHTVELTLSAELRGTQGPLPSGKEHSIQFETYGPFAVQNLSCTSAQQDKPTQGEALRCKPRDEIWLQFNNLARFGEIKRALKIDPPLPFRWDTWSTDNSQLQYVSLSAAYVPGREYTISIDPQLQDVYGQKLAAAFSQKVRILDHEPAVEIGVEGDFFEPAARSRLPIGSINVPEYTVLTLPLSLEQVRTSLAHKNIQETHTQLLRDHASAARQVRPTAAKNQTHQESIDPRSVLQSQGERGPVFVGVSYTQEGKERQHSRVIQVTNLALSAKLSAHDTSVVWVTELSSAKPIAGAEVQVLTPQGSSPVFKTDTDGLVRLPAGTLGDTVRKEAHKSLLVVKQGSDWAYQRLSEILPAWRSDVYAEPWGEGRIYGLAFSERGIYRPSDQVHIKAIIRKEKTGGNEVLANKKFKLVLRSPDWEVLQTHEVQTNAYGSINHDLRLPSTAPLGYYHVQVQELEEKESYASITHLTFQVAEYEPVSLEAKLDSQAPSYKRGEKARFALQADYLYGAPLRNAPLTYQALRSETYYEVPQANEWITHAQSYDAAYPEKAPSSGLLSAGEAKLDSQGKWSQSVDLNFPGQRGPELVRLSAEVRDVGQQYVASTASAIVHPADYYVGLRPLRPYFSSAQSSISPQVQLFEPDGKKVSGRSVRLDLIRRRYTTAREVTEGRARSESRLVDEIVSSCTWVSQMQEGGCALQTKEAGYYVILATSHDAQGRVTRSSIDTYVLGTGAQSWADSDTRELKLIADKSQYSMGDTARILVQSPFPAADALVTVESQGVRQERRVRLEGATPTVEIPITEDMRPHAYLAVHILRARSAPVPQGDQTDLGAPTYRTGHAELRIEPDSRRLKLNLTPNKTQFLPGETVDVSLLAQSSDGQPVESEWTVYAVDEGVLSLIGYETPDPTPVFTAARPLRVATLESREALARVRLDLGNLLGLGPNKGAEGGGGAEDGSARKDFRQSAYFNASVITSASGRAQLSFQLPESLTTYRLMAVGSTKQDQYGYAQTRLVTSKPLMARPALPRFFRVGDQTEVALVVSGKDIEATQVEVQLSTKGLQLQGPARQSVALPAGESKEVRFPVKALQEGNAELSFQVTAKTAQGKTLQDSVKMQRPVRSPHRLETVSLYGQTQSASAEELGELNSVQRDRGGLEVKLASTALVGLDTSYNQLIEYPYLCTEQLSSRLLPLTSLRELAQALNLPQPEQGEALLESTVQLLLKRQRYDGGFSFWSDSSESSPWVSGYALLSLHAAQKQFPEVPASVFTRGKSYLRQQLKRHFDQKEQMDATAPPLSAATAAFLVDVLSELGDPDAGYMNLLFQERASLPTFSQAFLLHAMARSKQPQKDVETLTRELSKHLHIEADRAQFVEDQGGAYAPVFDSSLRTTALILRALLAAEPQHALASQLARGILDARERGTWRSTQETAYALLALDAYRRTQESKTPQFTARLWSEDTQLLEHVFKTGEPLSRTQQIGMAELKPGRLIFEKQGTGTLFYEARLRYAPQSLPTEPLDRGFYIQKAYRSVTPQDLSQALQTVGTHIPEQLPVGELVLVDLMVVTPSPRHYAIVEDPLPAGFEAIQADFKTSAAWTQISGSLTEDPEKPMDRPSTELASFLPSSYHRELRDDRVLFFIDHLPAGIYHYRYLARATSLGSFILPPTRAEEMYSPEVFGRTGAQTLRVQ